jgi:very-short-patch-repair endonuclease
MSLDSIHISNTLETLIDRLLQSVNRSALLKAFPTKSIKRVDLERLRIISPDAPEQTVRGLLGPQAQVHLRFESFTAVGKAGEESRQLFSVLRTSLSREAQLVFRETGLRTLWLAYPLLHVPFPDVEKPEFLLAPLFLWPLRILASGMPEGELVIARDPEGGPPRFNRVAMQWIRRYLDFEPAEPSAFQVRDAESLMEVENLCKTLCDSFRPGVKAALLDNMGPVPSKEGLLAETQARLYNSGLIGLIQWENQELIRDLENIKRTGTLSGAANDLLRDSERSAAVELPLPEESDRFLVTDTDQSQERAVWMARMDRGVVVHGPPGTGKSQVIVNIVADCLAHNQRVLVVCQKKAALDVVASRLTAAGLGELFLQVDDAEADRRRVIETLRTQERPLNQGLEEDRRNLAARINRIENELDTYQRALFEVRSKRRISFRKILTRIGILRRRTPGIQVLPALQNIFKLKDIAYPEVQRLADLFGEIEAVYCEGGLPHTAWRFVRQDVSDDPNEREEIALALHRLASSAEKVDKWAGVTGPEGGYLEGDCEKTSQFASQLRNGLVRLKRSYLEPSNRPQPNGKPRIRDHELEQIARAVSVLLRWQGSPLRFLIPSYQLAKKHLRLFITRYPWLASSSSSEILDRITQRASTALAVLSRLNELRRWLEESFTEEQQRKVRDAKALLPIVTDLQKYLPGLPALLRFRSMKALLSRNEVSIFDAIISDEIDLPKNWRETIELSAIQAWLIETERETPILRAMSPELYQVRRNELSSALARKKELEPLVILSAWSRQWEELDLRWTKALAVKGKSSRRLREIVEQWADKGLMVLRPCWLVNPGTASQIFPLQAGLFDLVVFDEASQCPPEYAVAALFRGRRAVVAGDAKQLPPTMFFKSTFDFEAEDEDYLNEKDDAPVEAKQRMQEFAVSTGMEDLLGLAQARLPDAYLNVHYRSRDPILISFSNAAFYGNRLQTPKPAGPVTSEGHPALSLERVDGRYSLARTNPEEADRVVEYVRRLWGASASPPTLGVVTFNEPQQQAILDRFDELARKDIRFGLAYEREQGRHEGGQDVGFFVRNLEAVQGDERDVMLFSTTYGHRHDRPFSRAFLGPLNRAGGERRLNVAISRAKFWVRIFTSLPIEQIAEALIPEGVPSGDAMGRCMLQLYLAYANHVTRGDLAAADGILVRALRLGGQASETSPSTGPEDSEFEIEVGDRIREQLGVRVDPQVGSGTFRIDLGVRHPEDESRYILGIECDGKAYHSAPAARAYDLWRQRILVERGWRIVRIWSTSWRQDPNAEIGKVERAIRDATRVPSIAR